MIHEYFKVSDTDESVLECNESLKVDLKKDNAQSFNARWDETIIAMKKQPDEENVEICDFRNTNKATVALIMIKTSKPIAFSKQCQ